MDVLKNVKTCELDEIEKQLFHTVPPAFSDNEDGLNSATAIRQAGVRPMFVDVLSVVYRFIYAKADEYTKQAGGSDTLVVALVCCDVVSDIASACEATSSAPVLCFDSAHSYRKEYLYTEYKEKRREGVKSETIARLLRLRRDIGVMLRNFFCPVYRIQYFLVYGFESDDLIAKFVRGLKEPTGCGDGAGSCALPKRAVFILSNDHDLHQLVFDDNVFFADVRSGKLLDADAIVKQTGVARRDLIAYKTIGGCQSDNINGVDGCGKKTLMEILKSRSFKAATLKRARVGLNSAVGRETMRRNMKLVTLPLVIQKEDGNVLQLPSFKLRCDMWPKPGVPERAAKELGSLGIGDGLWPAFGDVRAPSITSGPIRIAARTREVGCGRGDREGEGEGKGEGELG